MPHEVTSCHTAPTMRTHKPLFLKGWFDPEHNSRHGVTVFDACEISDRPAQLGWLGSHEVINGHSLRKDFNEILDFRDGVIDAVAPL